MSSTPRESLKLSLELGDIITIIAPDNTQLNDKTFFIQYLDNDEVDLVDAETGTKQIIAISDGKLADKTIEKIIVLSSASQPGYARQNNLLPGTWISIQIGGDVPITLNGKISSLEEDMIEISLWPDGKKVYIDFGYKGIPKNLPIESIRPFVPPKPQEKSIEESESPLESPVFESPDVVITPELDDEVVYDDDEQKSEKVPELIIDVPQERKAQLFSADEVVFGEELEELNLYVDVPEEEIRYGLEAQSNDLLNDLLSTIPAAERTKNVYNSLHIMIERFRQLRQIYSETTTEGDSGMPEMKGSDYKPMVKALENMDYKLYWILPIVKNNKVLYNFELDEDLEPGIAETTLALAQESIYDINQQYKGNIVPDGQNKYLFKYRSLNPYLTPFKEPTNMSNVIINKETGTTLNVVLNNDLDMQSLALCGNLPNEYVRTSKAAGIHLEKNKFLMARYETGLTHIKPKDIRVPSLNTSLLKITPNDIMSLVGTLTLPESVMRYSQINLPETSIYTRAILNEIPFTYKRYLNSKTKFTTTIIDQETLGIEGEKSSEEYLTGIVSYLFSENTAVSDRGSQEFKEYLNKIIPRTRELFNLIKKFIINSTSYLSILEYLQPFLIFPDDITFKQYETIINYMTEEILQLKKLLAGNRGQFIQYIDYKYGGNTAFKNSYLFNLLNSATLKKHNALAENIQNHYNLEKATTCEFIRKLLITDDGRLFMNALALDDIELFVAFDIEEAIQSELQTSEQEEGKVDDKKDCKNFVLAKYYLDIDDLRRDDGTTEVYFDDKYDETRYDIIREFADQQASMTPDIFNNFLVEHLESNVGLEKEVARREADALINKKRRVVEGDYALIVDSGNENIYYRRDDNNTWIQNPDMDGEPISQSTFCNLKKQCLSINEKCDTLIINKKKIKQQLIEDMLEQFDTSVKLSNTALLETLVENLNYNINIISKLTKLRTIEELKYDIMKKLLGDTVLDRVVAQSPHALLRNLILSQEDFVAKQTDILKFINKTCRPAQIIEGEDDNWFYCIDSDLKLLPTFYEPLANAFFSQSYEDVLNHITATRGEISDDGDKIVDKYSGYLIRRLEFDEAEGYDEAGYKIVSRAILNQDIGDILIDMSFKPTETLRSTDGEMIRNVILTLSKQLNISIGSELDFIIHNVESTLEAYLPSEESHARQVSRAKKHGRTLGSYTDVHDEALLLMTLAYFLVVTQTMMPSVRTSKTFRGCGPKSFKGYPLEGVGDYTALKYLCCVALKLRSRTRPWQRLPKLTRDKAVAILKQFMGKMKNLIDKELLPKDIIQDKIKAKLAYEEGEDPDVIIPTEFDVRHWITFLPPLHPIKIVGLQSIGPTFRESLAIEVKEGNPVQFTRMANLYGKMTLFSLQVQELIQRAVNKSVLLLENINNELLIENSCCNDGNKNTVLYFEEKENGIIKSNDTVIDLEGLYNTIQDLIIPAYLYDPKNTKLQYPNAPVTFSKKTIYKAFIRFCYFNTGIILDSRLQTVCGRNASAFKNTDDIATKIGILESERRVFSLPLFLQLMNIVNKDNIIDINLRTLVHSPRALLEAYIKNSEILRSLSGSSLVNFMAITETIFDRYDVMRSSDKEGLAALSRYETFLNENIDSLTGMIGTFLHNHSGNAKVEDFLIHIDNWKLRGENIYMSKEDETAITYVNWSKNAILNILKVFPTIIENQVDFTNPPIPHHWKTGSQKLSHGHIQDIQKIIREEYSSLSEFYDNALVESILEDITTAPEVKVILDLASMFPFFADVRIVTNEAREATILNGVIMKKIMKYLTLFSLSLYITKTHDNISKDDQVVSSTEAKVTLEDEIIEGKNLELNTLIGGILRNYLTIMEKEKNIINISNYQINQDVLKSKEKEKAKITKRLGDLSVDERRVEDIMKNQRLGKWGVGQTRALFVYDEDQYDKERAELEKDALDELQVGNIDGVTERTRDIYRMEHLEEQLVNDRIQRELDAEILAVPGDDDFGDRDDDAIGYAAWTGDE